MTIDEAIEILRKDLANPGSISIEDLNEAEQLGIEALKRLKALSPYPHEYLGGPLPEETVE